MSSPKLSLDKMNLKSPKFSGFRSKKAPISPYSKPKTSSTPKTICGSKESSSSKPFSPLHLLSANDEPTKEYICMICLEYLQPNNTCFTSCGHIFHQNCLNLWYKNKAVQSCPLCRTDNVVDNALLPVLPQSEEDNNQEDFAEYNDYESLQQCVMTSIFELWPISTLSKQQPRELLTMANRTLECSQKAFKSEQFLQAYRLLRRSIHFHDCIMYCEHLNGFMKQYGCEYNAMEPHFDALLQAFDNKFSTFFSKITVFKKEVYATENYCIESYSTKFTFSL